jgi:hypothetical protein
MPKAISVSRPEMSGDRLRIEGKAAPNRTITVDGAAMGNSDGDERFKVENVRLHRTWRLHGGRPRRVGHARERPPVRLHGHDPLRPHALERGPQPDQRDRRRVTARPADNSRFRGWEFEVSCRSAPDVTVQAGVAHICRPVFQRR